MIYRFLCFLILVCVSLSAAPPSQQDEVSPETQPIIVTPPSSPDNLRPSPEPETTPAVYATADYEHAFVKMMLTLVLLLALIIATVWLLRRYSSGRLRGMNRNLSIKILERRPLSQKTSLYIIEAGGKKLLVSESQWEVRTLSQMEEEATPLDTET